MTNSRQSIKAYDQFLLNQLRSFLDSDELLEDAWWPFMVVGTIDDYLQIREKFEGSDWFRAQLCDTDEFELNPKLMKLAETGFPDTFMERLVRRDENVFDELSIWLLSQIDTTRTKQLPSHAIGRGAAPKPSDIRFLAALMLERAVKVGNIPNSLMYLVLVLLVGENPEFRADFSFRRFADSVFCEVARMTLEDKPVSARAVAKRLGVSATTITRQTDRLREHWDNEVGDGKNWAGLALQAYDSNNPELIKRLSKPLKFPF